MKYFTLLPKIEYGNGIKARNLNWKYYFETEIDPSYLTTYRISDGENLESICNDLYKDTTLWWLISILNDIRDVIFDLPITEEALQRFASDLASETYDDVTEEEDWLTEYATQYDLLVVQNDTKRTVRIIKPAFIQPILRQIVRQT